MISSNISDLSSFFRLINLIIQLFIIILKNMLIHLGASFVILVIFLILCYSHLSIDQKNWFITFSDAEKFLIFKHFILTSFQFYPFVSNPALRYCTVTKKSQIINLNVPLQKFCFIKTKQNYIKVQPKFCIQKEVDGTNTSVETKRFLKNRKNSSQM